MIFYVEVEDPDVVGLGVVFSYEDGYKKAISLTFFKWVLTFQFGKGASYDRQV